MERARLVEVPMVQESPVKFECRYHSTVRLPGDAPMDTADVIIARVVAVHSKDEALTDGFLDVRDTFDMHIPGMGGRQCSDWRATHGRIASAEVRASCRDWIVRHDG